jgi:hypothetical protein
MPSPSPVVISGTPVRDEASGLTVFKDPRGLIVVAAVDPQGPAARAGVQPGDAVMNVGTIVVKLETFPKLMKNYAGRPVAMWRGDLSRVSPQEASSFSCGDSSSRETVYAHDSAGRIVGYSYCWALAAGHSSE